VPRTFVESVLIQRRHASVPEGYVGTFAARGGIDLDVLLAGVRSG
jgi:hypothetical protein